MKKLRLTLFAMVALLGALIAAALFVEFDVSGLGRRVLETAGKNSGITIQANRFRLHLRRGFVLEEVVATTEIAAGTVTTRVDRVVLEHRFWPLLRGDIVIDRLIMEKPVIEVRNVEGRATSTVTERESAPRQPIEWEAAGREAAVPRVPRVVAVSLQQESAPVAALARNVVVNAASIIDGKLVILSADGTTTTTATGLDAEVSDIDVDSRARSVAEGLTAHGHIDIGELHYAGRVASGNRAGLTANKGVYTVSGLMLTTSDGSFRLDELVVDVTRNPYVYRTSLSGNDLDLNRLLALDTSSALGTASFEVNAVGTGAETSSIIGKGRIRLSEGRIPDFPALAQVADLLGLHLAGLRYEATTIDFLLGDDRVEIAPFEIISEMMRLEARGNVDSDGAIDGRAHVLVPRENIDLGEWGGDFSEGVIDVLTDESGWVSIPLLIGGNVEEPRVAPDSDALIAALQQSAGQGIGKWLQGIIKR